MLLPGRHGEQSSQNYRYGLQGKEVDDEVKGKGNSYDFGARIYDPRIGKWLSMDAVAAKKPYLSPYQSMKNNPIIFVDPDGNDEWYFYSDGTWRYTKSKKADSFYEVRDGYAYNIMNPNAADFAYYMLPFTGTPIQTLNDHFNERPLAWELLKKTNPGVAHSLNVVAVLEVVQLVFDVASAALSLPDLVEAVYSGGKLLITVTKHGYKLTKGLVSNSGTIKFGKITFESAKALKDVSANELSALKYLEDAGSNIKVLARKQTEKTADFIINGKTWELKTISNITSTEKARSLSNRIIQGGKQSANVIVDMRKQTGFTDDDVTRGAYGAFRNSSKPQTIRIIGDDFDRTFYRPN